MAALMTRRAPAHWFWRDLRLVYWLLVWVAFASSLAVYFHGGVTLWHATPVAPPIQNDNELYTGSVFVMPPYGDHCWEVLLDNRSGRMWDYSPVDCDAFPSQVAKKGRKPDANSNRLHSISSAFRGAD